jgi:hypothetical protein
MAQPPGRAGSSGSPDADPHGQSTVPSPEFPAGAAETAHASSGRDAVTRSWSADPVAPSHPPTEVASPHPPTEARSSHRVPAAPAAGQAEPTTVSTGRAEGTVRRGPGVPVSSPTGQAGLTAEQVWRTGQLREPPRRRRRLRRVTSGALTVTLLAAAGVVLYLRFHHSPLQVTGVAITRQVTDGCAVDVIGRIATNGSAGTVSYQWLFQPQPEAPQPMSQSVLAGQEAVYVTAALEGQGHGSVARAVTLQVLSPGTGTASVHAVLSC